MKVAVIKTAHIAFDISPVCSKHIDKLVNFLKQSIKVIKTNNKQNNRRFSLLSKSLTNLSTVNETDKI
jgi:hypothetical protein